MFDLDGVLWLADRAIPGAAEAVEKVRVTGASVAFVTNNSYTPRDEVAAKLARFGIDPGHDVITSSMAAAGLVSPGETVLVVGGPGLAGEVERRGARVVREGDADVVVVGYDPAFDYDRMTAASTSVRAGARLLASNDDATYPTPRGLVPGGGAILASIERATGRRATVAGKPYGPMCELVREHLGAQGIVVGDRADTDGRFAVALGYRFGLVLSGVTTESDLPVEPRPDVVAADVAALVAQVLGDERG